MCNYSCSPKGRIWLGWDADKVIVQEIATHEQFIHVSVMDVLRQNSVHISVVYGLHTIDTRKSLWRDLAPLAVSTPWLILGDFHSVLYTQDRVNGAPVSNYETQDFAGFLDTVAFS